MKLLRWLWRLAKGIRDRIVWIAHGISDPPRQALWRLLASLRDRFDELIHRLLTAWANIFAPKPKDAKVKFQHPARVSWLVAAGIAAMALHTWNSGRLDTAAYWWAFEVLLIGGWLILRRVSRSERRSTLRRWLRSADGRAGLLWWERALTVASLIVAWLAFRQGHPRQGIAALAIAVGLLAFLITQYEPRTLRPLRPAPPIEPAPLPDPDQPGYVIRHFSWTVPTFVGAGGAELDVPVAVSEYEARRDSNPGRLADSEGRPMFKHWMVSSECVDSAAALLRSQTTQRGLSTLGEIANVLAFVQSIPYALDQDTKGVQDHWRYPVETVYDQQGDCEDTTLLAAAVMRRLGHYVAMAMLPEHAALGVEVTEGLVGDTFTHEGRTLYFCETTGEGWKVGDVPDATDVAGLQWISLT